MSKEKIITGLDIGTSYVRIVGGQSSETDGSFYVVGAVEVPSEGISKGSIVSIEDAVSSISKGLDQMERIIGQKIESVYAGVSGLHISNMSSRGVVAVSRPGGEIREDDIDRVINAAQAVATPPNYEILHVIPKLFTVDSQTGIKDPIGMTGVRLEVETQIIQGLSSQIKNLTKAISRTGLEIDDLVLSILANAESVLNRRQKELGVVLVNIGHSTTSVAVFEEGDILLADVLPIGSVHITNDIAIGLRTSLEVAESIKLEYGSANPKDFAKKEEIDLSEFDLKEENQVSLKHISEIIHARLEEIFEMVDKTLVEIDRSGLLPAGVVLTGGGAELPGIIEVAKKEFRLPASLGKADEINTAIDKVKNLAFSNALGLAMWGWEIEKQFNKNKSESFLKSIKNNFIKIKNWFKNFIS
ncbi:MAG: cell division protein FtsA [Patescibacteria group bacterium]